MAEEQALRYNEGKADLAQILEFGSALAKLAEVMSQGAIKYTPRNWLKGGKPDEEYLNSAMRHMEAFVNEGEWDADNGTHHIAHAAWNMLALLRLNYDDLPTLDPDFDQEAFLLKYVPILNTDVELSEDEAAKLKVKWEEKVLTLKTEQVEVLDGTFVEDGWQVGDVFSKNGNQRDICWEVLAVHENGTLDCVVVDSIEVYYGCNLPIGDFTIIRSA